MLYISGTRKSENDDTYKIFNEFQKVVNEVTINFSKAPNKEHGDDEKCQWFIVSLMRSVATEEHWSSLLYKFVVTACHSF